MNFKRLKTGAILFLEAPELIPAYLAGLNIHFVKDMLFGQRSLRISPSVILDIGAYKGDWAKAANYVYPDATIYAFEPMTPFYEEIVRWASKKPNIHPVNTALGRETKSREFYVNEFAASSSMFRISAHHIEQFPFARKETPTIVNVSRLDEILPHSAAKEAIFCKLDVHGAELEVLGGFGKFIEAVKVIQIEIGFTPMFEMCPSAKEIINYLFDTGFKSFYQTGIVASKGGPGLLACDLIFIR